MESNVSTSEAVSETNASAASTYTVSVVNNSTYPGSACIFQKSTNGGTTKVLTLAWLCQSVSPGTQANIEWNTNYSFYWAYTGLLGFGNLVDVQQTIDANPSGQNATTLEGEYGQYYLTTPTNGYQPGVLTAKINADVQRNMYSVGIGMSGAPAFVAQANPGNEYAFSSSPEYWIVFGVSSPGVILDIQTLQGSAQLKFSQGSNSLKAVFNSNFTWTIEPA